MLLHQSEQSDKPLFSNIKHNFKILISLYKYVFYIAPNFFQLGYKIYCSKPFTCMNIFNPHNYCMKYNVIVTVTLQMKKLRHTDVNFPKVT